MVTNVTNLGRSGVFDWTVQRVSAVILLAYTLFLLGFIAFTPDISYDQWQDLFSRFWMRLFSLLALLSLLAHAWVGMWTVYTDYLTPRTLSRGVATKVRFLFQVGTVILLFVYLVWCIQILWSI